MTSNHTRPLRSPWVLVDQLTVQQTADVLDRLTSWLNGPDTSATARCTHALSLGERHLVARAAGDAREKRRVAHAQTHVDNGVVLGAERVRFVGRMTSSGDLSTSSSRLMRG